MKDNKDYYAKIENAKPHPSIHQLDSMLGENKVAVELGCGSGRDTLYLLEKGYQVIGIDKEDTEKLIRKKLYEKENQNFTFIQAKFGALKTIEKNDLVVSNFAIPFCLASRFQTFWKIVCESIKPGGYFLGNFFGLKDEWNHGKREILFFSMEEVQTLFKDFEIIEIAEKEYDKPTANEEMKHWDVIEVFARHL